VYYTRVQHVCACTHIGCGQRPYPWVGHAGVVRVGRTGAPGIGLPGSQAYPWVPHWCGARWSCRGVWDQFVWFVLSTTRSIKVINSAVIYIYIYLYLYRVWLTESRSCAEPALFLSDPGASADGRLCSNPAASGETGTCRATGPHPPAACNPNHRLGITQRRLRFYRRRSKAPSLHP
jgi:hypothetical protein